MTNPLPPKTILILGAGRSCYTLIHYLIGQATQNNWTIRIGDKDLSLINTEVENIDFVQTFSFDINDSIAIKSEISKADIVVSMLPARFHHIVGFWCVEFNKPMVTASYVSEEMLALDKVAKEKKVLLLNECGLDPGIDHMSAMKIIDDIKSQGGVITSFKSYTGGLISPEHDNNPWNYKFTWNPRNVVLAGQGTTSYIEKGSYKYIPYHRLFTRLEKIHVRELKEMEGYPNRDSLAYREVYGLNNIPTIIRGTIRKKGFCDNWNIFVQLGMTDDSYKIEHASELTFRQFTNSFLEYNTKDPLEVKMANFLKVDINNPKIEKLKWLGLFSHEKINLENVSPAEILQHLLEKKWHLADGEKDMIVMQHKINFMLEDKEKEVISSMVVYGNGDHHTAMSKTVGLPLGIAVKRILNNDIHLFGVHRPIASEIYTPILTELETLGISFLEN